MDETFQALMPLEDGASVYSIVYPGGSTPIGAEEGQSDFLQFLLSQLTTTFNINGQAAFEEVLPFSLPVNTSENAENDNVLTTGPPSTNPSMSTAPFLPIMGEEGFIFPGAELLLREQPVMMETPGNVAQESVLVPLGDNAFSGMEKGIEIPFMVNSGEGTSGENVGPEQHLGEIVSSFSGKVPFDGLSTAGALSSQGQSGDVPVQTVQVSGATDVVDDQMRGSDESILESIISNAQEQMEINGLSLRQRVDLKNLEGIQLIQHDYVNQQSDNVVLNDSFQQNGAVVDFMPTAEEPVKIPLNITNPFSVSFDFFGNGEIQQSNDLGTSFALGSESSFQDTQQTTNADGFNDLVGSDQLFQAPTSEGEIRFESVLEGRIRQAQEAQSIAQQIIKAAHFRQGFNYSEFKLTLEPEYLGNLRMSIMVEDDVLLAKIITDNAYTRDVLSSNLAVLKDSLESNGIRLNDVEVCMEEGYQGFDSFQGKSETSSDHAAEEKFPEEPNSMHRYEEMGENSQVNTSISSPVVTDGYHVNYLA